LKGKFLMVLAVGLAISIFSAPLAAHHGYAAYDTDKKVTVKGTVTDWRWSNPHCVLQIDVKDESGNVAHWVAETENPATMARNGWSKEAIKVGDQITLSAIPVKNGRPVGRILEIELSNGQHLAGRINPATEVKPDENAKP
jgi:uncharacterized protein DUF6152